MTGLHLSRWWLLHLRQLPQRQWQRHLAVAFPVILRQTLMLLSRQLTYKSVSPTVQGETCCDHLKNSSIIIIIIIHGTMFMVLLSSWHKLLREFTRFIWRMQASSRWLPTFRPGQPTWAVSLPVGCYITYIHHRHLLLLNPKADLHFTVPLNTSLFASVSC